EPDERVAVTHRPDDHGAHHCVADPAVDERFVEVAPARRDEIHEHLTCLSVGHRSLAHSSVCPSPRRWPEGYAISPCWLRSRPTASCSSLTRSGMKRSVTL